jgi:hypothetical protein
MIQDALKKPWPNVPPPPPPKVAEIVEEKEKGEGKEEAGVLVA